MGQAISNTINKLNYKWTLICNALSLMGGGGGGIGGDSGCRIGGDGGGYIRSLGEYRVEYGWLVMGRESHLVGYKGSVGLSNWAEGRWVD